MKAIYQIVIVALGILTTKELSAQDFITLWKPSSGEITIPVTEAYAFNYDIEWYKYGTSPALLGDSSGVVGDLTISGLNDNDTIEIRISGIFPTIAMMGSLSANQLRLIDVKQWGNIQWLSFYGAFYNCANVNFSAADKPLLSQVTSMEQMFDGATQFNSNISDWDVSTIIEMDYMFSSAEAFNQNIGNWDVSHVTNMEGMFLQAIAFNQDIGNWDVGQVDVMGYMFKGAESFNGNIRNWDVSHVGNMTNMFKGATQFNSDIGNWDVSSVQEMSNILTDAISFNHSLEDWDLANIDYYTPIISLDNSGISCYNYSRTLHGWAINPYTSTSITLDATNLSYSPDLSTNIDRDILMISNGWTISGDATGSCSGAVSTDFITVWKTDNSGVTQNNQIILPLVGEYDYTFARIDPLDFNDTIPGYSGYGRYNDMTTLYFDTAGVYRITITPFDSLNPPLHRISFNNGGDKNKLLYIEQWGNYINWSSFENAFYGCTNLDVTATDIPKLTNVTNTSYAFAETGLSTLPNFNLWDLSNVTNMSYMFKGVSGFMPDMGNWDVSNVSDMSGMFAGATDFNQNISGWDVSNVINMSHMFDGASSFEQDLSGWDVSNVTDMSFMFKGASGLTNIGPAEGEYHSKANGVDNWDVGQVTNMEGMFANAISFNGDIGNWDVGQVTSMTDMFSGAISFNGDLGNWDVGQLTANGISGSNDISFANSGMSCGNYSLTLQGWANQSNTPLNIVVDATGMNYSPDITADRNSLINDNSWTFNGDNEDSNCFLSIEKLTTSSFIIYPNPTQDQFTITGLSGNETIQLVDMTGRVLQTVKSQNNTSESIEVSQLANGVYNLVISTENGQKIIQKLIKQ